MHGPLNRQVFLALATIAWADGQLAPEERDGILRAARASGWSEVDVADLGRTIATPVDLSGLVLRKLSALDRVYVYAMGEWLARIDGHVDPREEAALQKLGDFLMISERVRGQGKQASLDIAALPSGTRPDKFDLMKLRALLEQRMR